MSIGRVSHGLRLIQSFASNDPAGVVALEQRQPAIARLGVARRPRHVAVVFVIHKLVSLDTILVHAVILLVVHQRQCEGIVLGHLATEEKRRVTDAPQRHHRQLFVLRQIGPSSTLCRGVASVAYSHGNLAKGQHIAVCIVARSGIFAPFVSLVEHGIHMAPVVPQVVHHTPHVGVRQTFLSILVLGLARRQRQHDGATTLVNGFTYHVYLVGIEWPRHIVNLNKIDTPLGIEVDDAIVV